MEIRSGVRFALVFATGLHCGVGAESGGSCTCLRVKITERVMFCW
jgi:hypothetical protein